MIFCPWIQNVVVYEGYNPIQEIEAQKAAQKAAREAQAAKEAEAARQAEEAAKRIINQLVSLQKILDDYTISTNLDRLNQIVSIFRYNRVGEPTIDTMINTSAANETDATNWCSSLQLLTAQIINQQITNMNAKKASAKAAANAVSNSVSGAMDDYYNKKSY